MRAGRGSRNAALRLKRSGRTLTGGSRVNRHSPVRYLTDAHGPGPAGPHAGTIDEPRTPKGGPSGEEPPYDYARQALTPGDQKPMSPPMPPVGSAAPAPAFSGLSAMTASVVRKSAAMEAAFCSAERVTFAGSMMPSAIMST